MLNTVKLSVIESVETYRAKANKSLDESKRASLGQYMSSAAVSELLASMFDNVDGDIKLLDAGAGVGSLTAAFIARASESAKSIDVSCFEISDVMRKYLSKTLEDCELLLKDEKIDFNSKIYEDDFIENSVLQILDKDFKPTFNKAILNPPYLKIAAQSSERKLLKKIKFETGNLYSAFVGLAILLLEDGGELVAITPRSFCNGPYFKGFRKLLFEHCSLNKIHVFDSRKSAFKEDKVLQENVVFHLKKGGQQSEYVDIYSSNCALSDEKVHLRVRFDEVVSPTNPDKFIHIITNDEERELATSAGALPCSLSDLGLEASTGRVVDFRTREALSSEPTADTVPLIYPANIQDAQLVWPNGDCKKSQYLIIGEKISSLGVKNGTYVLTRRLTAKEEERRIVAALYTGDKTDKEWVGFENKTNYFHALGKPIDYDLARGLWIFLNSSIVDRYFRQFNGHTQVNAADLRILRYPDIHTLKKMSELYKDNNNFDSVVNQLLF
ncbi:Eco57I restriction-modification methylase domain-containing protein [Alteromonas sp. 1_MG-2023]|uniref:Eco57I restriction-modification methylase domain-containing protein n=1 Tax=Alteromonas sp. 1_MG-2023 TaxID=3062669 RepID=UPI0026E18E86|nr:Eco57I restriction-modification methylase domain-containing protein [Alteromonas sp. 1_MG-2023]MDO6476394.1 Eco57I restriction-modification methylase domain-containing protein [Alteromonas sp. 1_MG-2023]